MGALDDATTHNGFPNATDPLAARVGLTVAPTRQIDATDMLQLVRTAEGYGFHSIWVPETWGADAVSLLATLSCRTENITLAAGVFNVYSRSAMLLAQTAATLQTLSGGRFILGLGASGPKVIENWHGMPYQRPIVRTREYIEAIRMALHGSRVDFHGEDLRLAGFSLQNPPTRPVPIYIAALGPKNVALAGEIADGWLPIFAARGHMQALFSDLREGATRAGRQVESVDVAAFIPAAAGSRAELLLRQQIAYYVGAMGTFYASVLSRVGFQDEVARVRGAWTSGDHVSAVRAVSDRLLDVCTIIGSDSRARDRLDDYRRDGVALPILALPHGTTTEEAADLLECLAPAKVSGRDGE